MLRKSSVSKLLFGGVQFVDFRPENKIAFGQAADLVRVDLDIDFSPREAEIGVMPLLLGHFPDAIDKIQSLLEIRKSEALGKVMFFDDVPAGQLLGEGHERIAF